MKKNILAALLGSTLLLTAFAGASYAKDSVVGIVDTQKIFQSSKLSEVAASAQKELEQLDSDLKKDTINKSKQLEAARDKKATDAELKAMQEKFQKEIEAKNNEGKQLVVKKQLELEDMRKKLILQITDAIKNVAKDKSIDVVVDKQAVLFGGVDITDDVIKKIK